MLTLEAGPAGPVCPAGSEAGAYVALVQPWPEWWPGPTEAPDGR